MIYLSLKKEIQMPQGPVRFDEIAQIWSQQPIDISFEVGNMGQEAQKVSAVQAIAMLKQRYPEQEILSVGSEETWLYPQQKQPSRLRTICKTIIVSIIIFFGGGLAIMNFHSDVDMPSVHQNVFYLLTGQEVEVAYWISIPYSIGIAVGIVVFMNVIRRKKNAAAHPNLLEVEFGQYKDMIKQYMQNNTGNNK
ncbi:MAG: hypothetical protein ACOYI4_06970 [Christensenellales bacterium]